MILAGGKKNSNIKTVACRCFFIEAQFLYLASDAMIQPCTAASIPSPWHEMAAQDMPMHYPEEEELAPLATDSSCAKR